MSIKLHRLPDEETILRSKTEASEMLTNETIMFFSRGKGRGHAIPDAAIAAELSKLLPFVKVQFVSYSVGAETLRELGHDVIDLALPEDNAPWDVLSRALPVMHANLPNLIVSHEEFCILPLASALRIPSIFLTDWFARPDSVHMLALKYADLVVFLDEQGLYDEPYYLSGKIVYVGPVLRRLNVDGTDKAGARLSLRIARDDLVVLVAPGGADMHSEGRAPLFDMLVGSFDLLEERNKRLLWVAAEPDYSLLRHKAEDKNNISILKPHFDFTPTLLASDLVITKGNRLPLLECEKLQIPSISVSFGYNVIDDCRIAQIRTNTALRARGLTRSALKEYMLRSIARTDEIKRMPKADDEVSRLAAAQLVVTFLRRNRSAPTSATNDCP